MGLGPPKHFHKQNQAAPYWIAAAKGHNQGVVEQKGQRGINVVGKKARRIFKGFERGPLFEGALVSAHRIEMQQGPVVACDVVVRPRNRPVRGNFDRGQDPPEPLDGCPHNDASYFVCTKISTPFLSNTLLTLAALSSQLRKHLGVGDEGRRADCF